MNNLIPRYGLIGDGRLARHLKFWFAYKGVHFDQWSRRASVDGKTPTAVLADCDRVILAISDDAIEPFINAWPELNDKLLIHCSGSLTTALAVGVHPLQTFGDVLFEPSAYDAIPMTLDERAPPFERLMPGLENPHCRIRSEHKAHYHALCVLACSGTQLLWREMMLGLGRMGIGPEFAKPLLLKTADDALGSLTADLTGPLSRNDIETQKRNLDALGGDALADVYRALQTTYRARTGDSNS
jgi:2-dehydropantoate 2-reductase